MTPPTFKEFEQLCTDAPRALLDTWAKLIRIELGKRQADQGYPHCAQHVEFSELCDGCHRLRMQWRREHPGQ